MKSEQPAPHPKGGFEKVHAPEATWRERLIGWMREWWMRLALGAAAIGLALYFTAVTMLYYRSTAWSPHDLTWGDFAAAPFNWPKFRVKQGRMLNARGMKNLANQRFNEAYFDLRAGLSRSMDEVTPRIAMAEITASFSVSEAVRELEIGLSLVPGSPELTEALITKRRDYGAWQAVLADTSPEVVARTSGKLRAVLMIQRADLLLDLGRPREAEVALAQVPAEFTGDLQYLDPQIRTFLALGRFDEARRLIESSLHQLSPSAAARLHCEIAVARGSDDDVAQAILKLRAVAEQPYESYLVAFAAWQKRGRTTLRENVERELLRFYGGEFDAMKRFGVLLIRLRDTATLARVVGALEQQGVESFVQQIQWTELALREGRFVAAFRALEKWEPRLAQLRGADRADPEFIRRLTRAANDDSLAQASLLDTYLGGLPSALAYPRYLLSIEVLERAGMIESAASITDRALRRFALSDRLTEKSLELNERVAAFRKAEAERLQAVAEDSERRFSDRLALWAAVDDLVRQRSFVPARKLLLDIRTARPRWLAEHEEELAQREILIAALVGEPVAAREAVRHEVMRRTDAGAVLRLLEWAKSIEAENRDLARMIRQEVAMTGARSSEVDASLKSASWEGELFQRVQTAESAMASMDEALGRHDPDHVIRLVALVRRTTPPWLATATRPVALRELQARLQLRQRPVVLVLLRNLAKEGAAARAEVRSLVRELALGGSYDDALFLGRSLLELAPSDHATDMLVGKLEIKAPL